jgi:hypothetical protein
MGEIRPSGGDQGLGMVVRRGVSAKCALVFRSFLTLSLVCGSRGHADSEWFVDLRA